MLLFIGKKTTNSLALSLRSGLGAGLLFLGLGFFWLTALLSQEPAPWVVGTAGRNFNLYGTLGTQLAQALWNGLGIGLIPLAFFWFVMGLFLLRPGGTSWGYIRVFSLGLWIPGICAMAEFWGTAHSLRLPDHAGGRLGLWISQELLSLVANQAGWYFLGFWLLVLSVWILPVRLPRVRFSLPQLGFLFKRKSPPIVIEKEKEEIAPKPKTKPQPPAPKPIPRLPGLPSWDLLEDPVPLDTSKFEGKLKERAELLEKTLFDFGLKVKVVAINTGPVITQFELSLETGLRLNKVTRLADDISLNLRVPSVRIVAPIPGKNTVGVEIPNELRAMVRMKEVLQAAGENLPKFRIPLFLGKDNEGRPLIGDLADMPHLLIAGSTGTGKSVCMNSIILSMLVTRTPEEVQMIMIDPKVVELGDYAKIPHLMHPVVHDMRKAEAILAWAVEKMEKRYELLHKAKVRNIGSYNELGLTEILKRVGPKTDEEKAELPSRMPYIVIFIDEMADLMMTMKKEVESHIIRLAQKSRAAGIHLVVATQKPTVDVITGLIKSNLPSRICFKVVNKSDSRVVLDEMGADRLLGKGDMLYLPPGTSALIRAQGTYASDNEIQSVVGALEGEQNFVKELVELEVTPKDKPAEGGKGRAKDDLYHAAVEVVIREGRGSVSLLQRALGIGYGRAARMVDWMAEDGVVGAYNGSSAREVVISAEAWERMKERV